MGDAIEMMSPHCSLVARGCTLNGATGVDTTDDGAHEAAHCELYDTTVVGEKQDFITTYFGPIYDFIMNLINTILSLFGSGVSAILQ